MKKSFYLLLLCLALAACKQDKKQQLADLKVKRDKINSDIKKLEAEIGATEKQADKRLEVAAMNLKKQAFYHYVDVQGKVDGEDNVAVSAQMLGVVQKIYVKEGDAVKKGQLLIDLDASVMKQGIEELKSSMKFVTDIYNKQKELWDQKIGSEVQYLTAKNNKESLENKLKTLEEQATMYQVKSPIDGTVEEIPVKVGQALSPGFNAIRIVNFSKIKVVADVAEAYSAKIKEGNEVLVYLPDLEKEIKAQIRFTSRFINPVNRTFMVEVRMNPGEADFRANMIAVLKIIDYSAPEALILPINLVQSDAKAKFVWVAAREGDKTIVRKQAVTTGNSYNGQVEVMTGMKEGDQVITTRLAELEEGKEIKVQ